MSDFRLRVFGDRGNDLLVRFLDHFPDLAIPLNPSNPLQQGLSTSQRSELASHRYELSAYPQGLLVFQEAQDSLLRRSITPRRAGHPVEDGKSNSLTHVIGLVEHQRGDVFSLQGKKPRCHCRQEVASSSLELTNEKPIARGRVQLTDFIEYRGEAIRDRGLTTLGLQPHELGTLVPILLDQTLEVLGKAEMRDEQGGQRKKDQTESGLDRHLCQRTKLSYLLLPLRLVFRLPCKPVERGIQTTSGTCFSWYRQS